jgi:lipopolysaccharide export system protein LptA
MAATMRKLALVCAAALVFAAPAHAEKTDREKPINLEADHMTVDDLKKIQTYEGKVVFTQGTLVLRADKVVVTDDAEGFHHGVATMLPGDGLAYFREKRDGVDEYVEGWGERIEYDSKADKAELFVRARLKRELDEARGNYISYDGKTEMYVVNAGTASSTPYNAKPRVYVTIQPKKKEPAVPAKPGQAQPKSDAASPRTDAATPKSDAAPAKPDTTPGKTDAPGAGLGLKTTPEIAHPRQE